MVYRNKSLERGFTILECLGDRPDGMSVAEVSRKTGLHRATTHRILEVLCGLGYAHKSRQGARYFVGFSLARFGLQSMIVARVASVARPILRRIAFELDELVHLGALQGIQAFYCDRIAPPGAMRLDIHVGDFQDAHATSIGKCLLAYRDVREVEGYYKGATLRAYTKRTITGTPTLIKELERVRAQGFAVNNEELMIGVRSIAAGLVNPAGRATCAISVTGPVTRLTDDRVPVIGRFMRQTAETIVEELTAPSAPVAQHTDGRPSHPDHSGLRRSKGETATA